MENFEEIEIVNSLYQNPKKDLKLFIEYIEQRINFSFIRFSDGEVEILNNNHLLISNGLVHTSAGKINHSYPAHDFKEFDPLRDRDFRADLIESAKFIGKNYFKGIRTKGNFNGEPDKKLMIDLNNGTSHNLTFTDLLINSNFITFRKKMLPKLINKNNVLLIANYRASTSDINKNWVHIALEDNFIPNYKIILQSIYEKVINLEPNSIILSSASSLSNLIAHNIWKARQDLTFIDIGTSIHDLIGLGKPARAYDVLLLPNTFTGLYSKIKYLIFEDYKIKW